MERMISTKVAVPIFDILSSS